MKEAFISIILTVTLFFIILAVESTQDASSNNLSSSDIPVIIIDAGHGGEDGGAVVQDNILEKDINLTISQKTNDIISLFGFKTFMVRENDKLIYDSASITLRQKKNSDLRNRLSLMSNL